MDGLLCHSINFNMKQLANIKQPPKIKKFKPLEYFEIERKYNDIQNEIKIFEEKLQKERDTLKFSQIVSAQNRIERLRKTADHLLENVEKDNKKKVYEESLKARMTKAFDTLNLRKSNSGWFREDKTIKTPDEIIQYISLYDGSLCEEYISQFGKKEFFLILKTQHFFWFGSELNNRWMNL